MMPYCKKKAACRGKQIETCLRRAYAPLTERHRQLFCAFMLQKDRLPFEDGFDTDYCTDDLRPSVVPLPVIRVEGICEIFLGFDGTDIYTRLAPRNRGVAAGCFAVSMPGGEGGQGALQLFRLPVSTPPGAVVAFVRKLKARGATL